ncbi:MAG: hypothetical protein ACE5IR_20020, partial [bacterium]
MKVVSLTKDKESAWDTFVENNPNANMYHLVGWKTIFERVFGYTPYYYSVENAQNEITGILPMFRMKDIFQRTYLISNPFSNFAGVCANGHAAMDALLEESIQTAKKTDARYVEFRQIHTKLNHDLPTKESFVTLMLDLPEHVDEIWSAL